MAEINKIKMAWQLLVKFSDTKILEIPSRDLEFFHAYGRKDELRDCKRRSAGFQTQWVTAKLLLALASTVILVSEPHRTRYHISWLWEPSESFFKLTKDAVLLFRVSYADLIGNTQKYYEIYSTLSPIYTVATVTNTMCKYFGGCESNPHSN
jgi:hypothetical protein